jgi:MscS family membrane protein
MPARLAIALAVALFALAPARSVWAQPRPTPSASASAGARPAEPEAPLDSPRGSVARFFELCRAGEYLEAAEFLDVPESQKAQAPLLARRLKAVLDRQIWVKLDKLSPSPLGYQNDALPPGVEQIGMVPGKAGQEPVRLVRRNVRDSMRWIFSGSTVERVNDWYARLQDRWLYDHLPEVLLRPGPRELLIWQWIALPLYFVGAWIVGRLLAFATRRIIRRLLEHADVRWDDEPLQRLSSPLALTWGLAAVYVALPYLSLVPPAERFIHQALVAGFLLAVFWGAMRAIDVATARFLQLPGPRANPAARSLVPLGAKAGKVVVFAMGLIAAFSQLGYPVASLVAGLGIGGVALALAAQKTMENLFGSVSIGVDQPFRVGDTITVDGVTGVVETIGLRSTRVRTQDRTVVTFPNGKLADMRIECVTQRDRIRFGTTLSLSPGTTAAQMRAVLERMEAALKEHPKIFPDGVAVAFTKVGLASQDLEVNAWFSTVDFDEFSRIRQDLLLRFVEIVEEAGTSIALPPPASPAAPPRAG